MSEDPRWQAVAKIAAARGRRFQLTVLRHGIPLVRIAEGCSPTDLFWLFSAGKPFIAVLLERLADQGVVDLDAPVAFVWPEFARRGKADITLRQVMQHRTGMPTAGSSVGDALAMSSASRTRRRIERARVPLDPDAGPAYQFLIFGAILQEVLERVTGSPLPRLLEDDLLHPLGLRDTYLGVPRPAARRAVPVRASGRTGAPAAAFLNRRSVRAAVIPSAGVSSTASDLATFYAALLADLAGTGPGVLSGATLARMVEPTDRGQDDQYTRTPLRWGEGLQLGTPRPGQPGPFGSHALRAFGHNGSNCCLGWADPETGLAVGYTTDLVPVPRAGLAHLARLSDAIISAAAADT